MKRRDPLAKLFPEDAPDTQAAFDAAFRAERRRQLLRSVIGWAVLVLGATCWLAWGIVHGGPDCGPIDGLPECAAVTR